MQKVSLRSLPALASSSHFSPPARLKGSMFDTAQDLAAFTESFDAGLKRAFSDNGKTHFVKFGSQRDNDVRSGVRGGKLSLPG